MKSVILCADDYALNESVSRGIVTLVEAGRLSATSVMTLSPRWAADAAELAPWRGRIDVGLHLDWTSEFALAAGHGAPLGALMRRSCWPDCITRRILRIAYNGCLFLSGISSFMHEPF